MSVDVKLTLRTRNRYNRLSPVYDLMNRILEGGRSRDWRGLLWQRVSGPKVLEVGVGTGRNFEFYPRGAEVTAIDLSEKMLRRAKDKAWRGNVPVKFCLMDVQSLNFPDDTFDNVVASFVFCSVPDPILGLREVYRVCRPGEKVFLLEHARSKNILLGWLMDLLNPLVVRITGANINRNTLENIEKSGLRVKEARNLWAGIVMLIFAEADKSQVAGDEVKVVGND